VKPEDAPAGQLTLSPIEQAFAANGVSVIPEGASQLTKKEMQFVLSMLEHGQMGRAAVEAGYSPESAASIASETLKKPKVFAFYRKCIDGVASKGEQLTARVYERSVILHAQTLKAAQELSQTKKNPWVLASESHQTGKQAKDVRVYELQRDRAQRDQKHFLTLANQTDALLGTLIGKIAGAGLAGNLGSGGGAASVTVPAEALPGLAAMRREVVAARMGGAN
jgi:phage terminase small subunit